MIDWSDVLANRRGGLARRGLRRMGIAGSAALALSACAPKDATSPSPAASDVHREAQLEAPAAAAKPRFRFVEAAAEVGLTRVILCGRPGKDHLLDSQGTGCAFFDYDGDGRLDVYLPNAWKLEGNRVVEKGKNALYRGRPDGSFEDVTDSAGVGGESLWCAGVTAADIDDDGRTDLYITGFGGTLLYHNLGGGKFRNEAAALGLEIHSWTTGAAFFDGDGDGDLDLYVAGYIECSLEDVLRAERTLDWKGVDKVAMGPFGLPGARDYYFASESGRKFTDATEKAGFQDRALAFGFGVWAGDTDGDGDDDVFVANDSDANYLYRNEGGGVFKETGLWSGCAFSASGLSQASMGIASGDVTGDGLLDLFVTNFSEDYSTLYRAVGGGLFEDVTAASGVKEPTYMPMSWGTAFADLDNDGDLDIVIANGHIYPQVDAHPEHREVYRQRCLLLENQEGHFIDATPAAGPGFESTGAYRGLAIGDYDDDGDLDILRTSLDAPPSLLRNESSGGSWITLALRGRWGSVGATASVTAGGKTQRREVTAGDSFLSSHDPRLHFGLGAAEVIDRIEVRWADGTKTVREKVAPRQILKLEPGS